LSKIVEEIGNRNLKKKNYKDYHVYGKSEQDMILQVAVESQHGMIIKVSKIIG